MDVPEIKGPHFPSNLLPFGGAPSWVNRLSELLRDHVCIDILVNDLGANKPIQLMDWWIYMVKQGIVYIHIYVYIYI